MIKKLITYKMHVEMWFGVDFGWIWSGFRGHLGVKMGPRGGQEGPKKYRPRPFYPTALRATSATALDERIPTWLQNPPRWSPKNDQKSIKNQSKIDQKSIKNRSSGFLGGLGALLTPRWPQERKRRPKVKVLSPYWGPFWSPKSIKIDPKSDLKCD